MKTLLWLTAIFALSAFLFSATVHAATTLADNLELDAKSQNSSIEELLNR